MPNTKKHPLTLLLALGIMSCDSDANTPTEPDNPTISGHSDNTPEPSNNEPPATAPTTEESPTVEKQPESKHEGGNDIPEPPPDTFRRVCDMEEQDCGPGLKCTNPLGSDLFRCAYQVDDPKPAFSACEFHPQEQANGYFDNCEARTRCIFTEQFEDDDGKTNWRGFCAPFCTNLDGPVEELCADGQGCMLRNGPENCFLQCNPRLGEEACTNPATPICSYHHAARGFVCLPDQHRRIRQDEGEVCRWNEEELTAYLCKSGLECVEDAHPNCEGTDEKCCSQVCDLENPECPSDEQACMEHFELFDFPIYEKIGLCKIKTPT